MRVYLMKSIRPNQIVPIQIVQHQAKGREVVKRLRLQNQVLGREQMKNLMQVYLMKNQAMEAMVTIRRKEVETLMKFHPRG